MKRAQTAALLLAGMAASAGPTLAAPHPPQWFKKSSTLWVCENLALKMQPGYFSLGYPDDDALVVQKDADRFRCTFTVLPDEAALQQKLQATRTQASGARKATLTPLTWSHPNLSGKCAGEHYQAAGNQYGFGYFHTSSHPIYFFFELKNSSSDPDVQSVAVPVLQGMVRRSAIRPYPHHKPLRQSP